MARDTDLARQKAPAGQPVRLQGAGTGVMAVGASWVAGCRKPGGVSAPTWGGGRMGTTVGASGGGWSWPARSWFRVVFVPRLRRVPGVGGCW